MFLFLDCLIEDTKTLEVVATNKHGKTSALVSIIVQGKPGTPEGPVILENQTEDSIQLSWSIPLFDGGSPISSYIVEKRNTSSDVNTNQFCILQIFLIFFV